MPSDANIVADLREIIDLGAVADDSVAIGAAVEPFGVDLPSSAARRGTVPAAHGADGMMPSAMVSLEQKLNSSSSVINYLFQEP
jgi:hypothetical protein